MKGISSLVIRHLNQSGVTAPGKPATPEVEEAKPEEKVETPTGGEPPRKTEAAPANPAAPAGPEDVEEEDGGSRVRVETVLSKEEKEAEARKKKAGPSKLDIRQKCDVRWRGWKLGSGQLSLVSRANEDGRGEYQLTGGIVFLGVLRQSWARLLRFKMEEKKFYLGAETTFYRMESAPGEEGAVITVWVKEGYDPQLFVYYSGVGGAVTILPEGIPTPP